MTDLSEIKSRCLDIFPKAIKGNLNSEAYDELREALNELVREVRRDSGCLEERKEIEGFFLGLFEPLIRFTVYKFIPSRVSEEKTFRDWHSRAQQIVSSIIRGDASPLNNKVVAQYMDKFESSESKHLHLNYKWIKADRDRLLGQQGTHKKVIPTTPGYETECRKLSTDFDWDDPWEGLSEIRGDGFLIRDRAAQEVAEWYVRRFKKSGEPTGYDPDYQSLKLKDLLARKDMVDFAFELWRRGELPEFQSELECQVWIEKNFAGMSLSELKLRIDEEPISKPDIIVHIFGKNKKSPLNRGHLYNRLRDFAKWSWKRTKNDHTTKDESQKWRNEKTRLEIDAATNAALEDELENYHPDELAYNRSEHKEKPEYTKCLSCNTTYDHMSNGKCPFFFK